MRICANTGVIPAGQPILQILFDWKSGGEEGHDYLRVWLAPVSYTPTAGNIPSGTGVVALSRQLGQHGALFASTSYAVAVTPGASYRVIFTWANDGTDPPAVVDNVSIISRPPALTRRLLPLPPSQQRRRLTMPAA